MTDTQPRPKVKWPVKLAQTITAALGWFCACTFTCDRNLLIGDTELGCGRRQAIKHQELQP